MLDKLGALGIVGLLLTLGGLGVVASQNLILAGGLALVLVGLAVTALGIVRNLLTSLGMGGMV
ncbi:DUF7470 family protein [Halapricum salinum]|uniref:Major facilitator superfamily (MFS) profile domain-containing protein n=1 Tax=Halapricum salinum TaxID=1457250 RepID=A0A4D6HF95_9EURY|nr:hypothetical protein [Halapricum salinum]QCC51838.1 hypothetical protein DV733_11590 [Halapricum salinum]